MSVLRMMSISVLGLLVNAPLVAQGIPSGATTRRNPAATTRVLVGNPYVFAAADSAAAVTAGRAMRERMGKAVSRDYSVIHDSLMNRALEEYGFPKDAILTPEQVRSLGRQINGRLVVSSTMSRGQGGAHIITARLTGQGDDVGNVVKISQGASPSALGVAAVDALQPAIRSWPDARACMDDRAGKPDKAAESANKALKVMPTNGLAHFCLAQLAKDDGTKLRELEAAVAGDSLALIALNQLAVAYEAKGDTNRTVAALQQMLRAAPTDQELRTRAFRVFLTYGRTDAAIQVAEEGLRADPFNWDLYDLKSNACLFAANYKCAVETLEQAYKVDSTRADTLFFAKITASADQRLTDTLPRATAADTAAFVRWAKLGAVRYPNNLGTLQRVNQAYGYMGEVDSSLAVTRKLLAIDSTNVVPALAAMQALATAKRYADVLPFGEMVLARGDAQAKEQAAGILTNAALPLMQNQPQDFKTSADMLRIAAKAAAPTGTLNPQVNYLLGLATLFQVPPIDQSAEKQKSCQLAQQAQGLLAEAEAAFTISKSIRPDESTKQLGNVSQFKTRNASMIKAYCR